MATMTQEDVRNLYVLSELDELNRWADVEPSDTEERDAETQLHDYFASRYREAFWAVISTVIPDEERAQEVYDRYMNDAEIEKVVYTPIDGKDFVDRLEEYTAEDKAYSPIIISDGHRCFVAGQIAAGKALEDLGYVLAKTWDTTLDGKERETHLLLHGTTLDVDEYFETVNGRAVAPGQFGIAEEDCNCRCLLEFTVYYSPDEV